MAISSHRAGKRWLGLGGAALVCILAGLGLWLLEGVYRDWLLWVLQTYWRKFLAVAAIAIVDIAFLDDIERLVSHYFTRLGLSRDLTTLGQMFIRWGLILIGVVLTLDLLGFRGAVQAILGTAGVVGLAVGLASRDVAANIIAGIFIILDDDLSVGDRIKIGAVSGRVVAIRLRHILVEENNAGALVIVPNTTVTSQYIWNYSRERIAAQDSALELHEDTGEVDS